MEKIRYSLKDHNLKWNIPPLRWLDGIFLGNGEMGAMIWGDGKPLKITLDKMDFWEERMPVEQQWGKDHTWEDMQEKVKAKDLKGLIEKYEYYMGSNKREWPLQPTRLPVPRMELEFGSWIEQKEGEKIHTNIELDLESATFEAELQNLKISGYIHADQNILVLKIKPPTPTKNHCGIRVNYDHLDANASEILPKWGYPPLVQAMYVDQNLEEGKREFNYVYQAIPEGQGGLLIAWTYQILENVQHKISVLTATTNNLKVWDKENDTLEQLLNYASNQFANFREETAFQDHLKFWTEFWNKSTISIPDNVVENLYYIELYKLACNTRYGKYPCPLQGVWTLDGTMPPWNGDYHFDMNVQETYWPIYATNHLELGEPLFRWLNELQPRFEENCRRFYGTEGLMTTCSISLKGENMHGYYNTEVWPGNGAWMAHMLWLYYLYTKNKCFLKQKTFPFMYQCLKLYEHLLIKDSGEWILPLSSSPEFHEHGINAWGKNTTCDLALIRWLIAACRTSIQILDLKDERYTQDLMRWKDIEEDLTYYPADFSGFQVFEDQPYDYPHRHMTHLFPIHPFHLVNVEGDRDDKHLIKASLETLRKIGDYEYTGWTLPWLSAVGSWANNSWLSYRWLKQYIQFITDTTMHINGDYKDLGICGHKYEPMTLEAGFTFAYAVVEMILKSWGGIIRICENLPRSWHEIRFENLRTEGAIFVSATVFDDQIQWISIEGEIKGKCKIKNQFVGKREKMHLYVEGNDKIIQRFNNEEYIEFEIVPETRYLLLHASLQYNEIMSQLNEEKANGIAPVEPLFKGKQWFGLQQGNRNPYLP